MQNEQSDRSSNLNMQITGSQKQDRPLQGLAVTACLETGRSPMSGDSAPSSIAAVNRPCVGALILASAWCDHCIPGRLALRRAQSRIHKPVEPIHCMYSRGGSTAPVDLRWC
jgi:hypothetical protein